MTDEELKNAIKAMADFFAKEASKEAQSDPLYKYIMDRKDWLKSPQNIDLMIVSKIKEIIHECVKQIYKTDDPVVQLIFTHWSFFDAHITGLCRQLYGNLCSADRGHYVLRGYIKYKTKGELPEWGDDYWVPPTGTSQQWMDCVEAVARLQYGNVSEYSAAVNSLLKTHKQEGESSQPKEGTNTCHLQ